MEKTQRGVGEKLHAIKETINQTAYDIRLGGYLWRRGPAYTSEELSENRLVDTTVAFGKGGLLGAVLGFAGPVFWEALQEVILDPSFRVGDPVMLIQAPEMNWMNAVVGTAIGLGIGTVASVGLAWRRGRAERLDAEETRGIPFIPDTLRRDIQKLES